MLIVSLRSRLQCAVVSLLLPDLVLLETSAEVALRATHLIDNLVLLGGRELVGDLDGVVVGRHLRSAMAGTFVIGLRRLYGARKRGKRR